MIVIIILPSTFMETNKGIYSWEHSYVLIKKGVLLNEQQGFKKRVGVPRISEKTVLRDLKTRHTN